MPSSHSIRSIRRALISVSDQTGILEFAKSLFQRGVKLLATGGTARFLSGEGMPITEISDYTGFPEMMDGRLKTLHPKVHGGILGRSDIDGAIMRQYDIEPIDMVVVNFYPFTRIARPLGGEAGEDVMEHIDIGGPTMVRSAAKNHKEVAILVNHCDYPSVITEMDRHNGSLTLKTRFNLAVKAFQYVTTYDSIITHYLGHMLSHNNHINESSDDFPEILDLHFIKKQDIRYGENSHQLAAFYMEKQNKETSVATAQQLQGKPLSYNNIADTDAALECVKSFIEPACVIVKHTNPCGVATAQTICLAYERAYKTDPTSAFGGVIAFNQSLDTDTAHAIISRQFVEVIIAPSVNNHALSVLSCKQNIRVLICRSWTSSSPVPSLDFKRVNGGLLVQDRDLSIVNLKDLKVVTKHHPTEAERHDALFSWKVAKFVKSNAIVYARDHQTIGIGAGQMSRIDSAKIAIMKARDAGLKLKNSVMASDAFFPFRDSIDQAAKIGIRCIIQPGGSIRDDEVIAAANEHSMAMIFTHMRHLRH